MQKPSVYDYEVHTYVRMYVYPCRRIIVEASSSVCHIIITLCIVHACIRTYHAISTALIDDGIRLRLIIQCTLSLSVGAFLQHKSLTWLSMQRQHWHFFPLLPLSSSWVINYTENPMDDKGTWNRKVRIISNCMR